jgi:hypothetical protein
MPASRGFALGLVAVLGPAAIATALIAHAQPAAAPADAHLGPMRCYIAATGRPNLERLKAKQLCTGATSAAPAQCLVEATNRVLGMSDLQAVRLCRTATSTAPALCAERLDDTTDLGTPTIVTYCAALRWSLLPAGTGGSPACVEAARDRTRLSDREAVRLCAGSTTTAPVACYELGDDETTLSSADIVDLCTTVVIGAPLQPWSP